MFGPARRPLLQSLPARGIRATGRGRFLSTAPPSLKSRSWKSSAARWALAIGGVYYYNTSSVFAETPTHSIAKAPRPEDDSSSLPTLEAVTAERRKRSQVSTQPEGTTSSTSTALSIAQEVPPSTSAEPPRTPQEYEDEADQQGAFNPETGEINWDCPCLGGMAHGPCGEQFRAAFSCFVFSKEEPKGMDCIDKFKGMQDCFRDHPDVYGSELEDDEEEHPDGSNTNATGIPGASSTSTPSSQTKDAVADHSGNDEAAKTTRAKAATGQVHEQHKPESETEDLVPKAWHDSGASSTEGR